MENQGKILVTFFYKAFKELSPQPVSNGFLTASWYISADNKHE